jgi:hypothetical protein
MNMAKGKIRQSLLLFLVASLACIVVGCRSSVNVKPDRSDFVTYRFGGGEAGADFTEITIRGDGTVSYEYHFPLKKRDVLTRKAVLNPAETKILFQDLVSAGLFGLKSDRMGGADLDWADIRAQVDNRRVEAKFIGRFEGLKEVRRLFSPLLKKMHPERWERQNWDEGE